MKHLLTLKVAIILPAAVGLLAVGVIYGTQLAFDVNITGNVTLTVTGDPIQVLSADGVTPINSGDALDFGTATMDFFGRGPVPVMGPFFVKNVSNGPVRVVVTGDFRDDIVPLFGPTIEELEPAPGNAFTLATPGLTGDTVRGFVGLRFLNPSAGSKLTTIIFRATATGDAETAVIQPPPGMVSWWPGDRNASDIMDGNHGILTGDFAAGMVGQGFSLDGTGDFVLVADNPNLNITGDVTVDLWAKRTSFGAFSFLIAKGAASIGGVDVPSAYTLAFDAGDRLLAFFERSNGSNVVLTGPVITGSNVHHYAYVRSGDTHKLFMDGVMVTGDTFTGGPGDTSALPLVIGAFWDGTISLLEHFGGVIDEVEIFDRALSDAEIRGIFEAGSAGKIKPPGIAPPAGMINWWPGDGTGDDIVASNHGTLTGDFVAGIVGQAFSFDGAGDSAVVGHDPSLDLNHFTLDAWVNPGRFTPGDHQAIITKNVNPRPPSLWLFGDKVQVWVDPVGLAATSVTGLTLGNWHHVATTYDGSNVKIYIDGSLDVSVPQTFAPATNTQPLLFGAGRDNDQFFFQGLIDEVEIFNRVLSDAEIMAIFEAGSSGKRKP